MNTGCHERELPTRTVMSCTSRLNTFEDNKPNGSPRNVRLPLGGSNECASAAGLPSSGIFKASGHRLLPTRRQLGALSAFGRERLKCLSHRKSHPGCIEEGSKFAARSATHQFGSEPQALVWRTRSHGFYLPESHGTGRTPLSWDGQLYAGEIPVCVRRRYISTIWRICAIMSLELNCHFPSGGISAANLRGELLCASSAYPFRYL